VLGAEGEVKGHPFGIGDPAPEITVENSQVTECVVLGVEGLPNPKAITLASDAVGPYFDAVIIHKGLVEWLHERIESFDHVKFLESLHALGSRVIVTSGRGAQMDAPFAEYPFVEFAVLESTLVRELSKVSLGNVIMAVAGKERPR
jgi:hypothetical protein